MTTIATRVLNPEYEINQGMPPRYQANRRVRSSIGNRYNQGKAQPSMSSFGKKPRMPRRKLILGKSDEALFQECMIEDEKKLFVPFPQKFLMDDSVSKDRREIHKWIYHYGETLEQSEITIQTAMVYIDKLIQMDKLSLLNQNKFLWAATALLVSSKFNEIDYKLIRIFEITGELFSFNIF